MKIFIFATLIGSSQCSEFFIFWLVGSFVVHAGKEAATCKYLSCTKFKVFFPWLASSVLFLFYFFSKVQEKVYRLNLKKIEPTRSDSIDATPFTSIDFQNNEINWYRFSAERHLHCGDTFINTKILIVILTFTFDLTAKPCGAAASGIFLSTENYFGLHLSNLFPFCRSSTKLFKSELPKLIHM